MNYRNIMFYNIGPWFHIHSTLFLLKLTNGPNKLECLSLATISSLAECNTLAYWVNSKVTKNQELSIMPLKLKYVCRTHRSDLSVT